MTLAADLAGDPRPFYQFSIMSLIGLVAVLAVGYIDTLDGEVRLGRGSRIVRAVDDPREFRGALILNYGMYATGALIAVVVGAVGGSAIQFANRSARP